MNARASAAAIATAAIHAALRHESVVFNYSSTRKVTEINEALCGTSFSKSLVSSLALGLDEQLEAWRNRPIEGDCLTFSLTLCTRRFVTIGG